MECRRGWPQDRLRHAGVLAAATTAAGVAALLAAGAPWGSLAGALVPAAAALLAHGVARIARRAGAESAAPFWGAAAPAVLAGALFVADPFIEWDGSTPQSTGTARRVYVVNPITAITSATGVDWQRQTMLYDGPAEGVPGLSYVGQYYPVGETPGLPLMWAAAVGLIGSALLLVPGRRGDQ